LTSEKKNLTLNSSALLKDFIKGGPKKGLRSLCEKQQTGKITKENHKKGRGNLQTKPLREIGTLHPRRTAVPSPRPTKTKVLPEKNLQR